MLTTSTPFGVKIPPTETFGEPVHVPPTGVPTNVTGIAWLHKVKSGPALTTGRGFTVTIEFEELEHPKEFVPVTVYVVVVDGFAYNESQFEQLNVAVGDHE